LKGLTVWYLFGRLHRVEPGESIVFHAAAGGVGLIACQWARHLGARLIGTAGSKEKAELALANGASEVILAREEDIASRVKELTGGVGVPVVYDSVGADTWRASLDSLRPLGLMVLFGSASGAVRSIYPADLMSRGSLLLTRPSLRHYVSTPAELGSAAEELFDLVTAGAINANIRQRYPLSEVARRTGRSNPVRPADPPC